MKNKKAISAILKGILVVVGICLPLYGIYCAFFDMERLPKEDLIVASVSPGKTYTVNAYLSSGHATTDFSVLGEVIWNDTKEQRVFTGNTIAQKQ